MEFKLLYRLMFLGTLFMAVFVIFGIIKGNVELFFHAFNMYVIVFGIILIHNVVRVKQNKGGKLDYLGGVIIPFFFPVLWIPYYFFKLDDWFHRIR